MNLDFCKNFLRNLASQGVRDICICPGARNAPFVEILSQTRSFQTLTFYDERSAGFFALGRARRDQRPVAVMTTSGTAVAELLPAAIEAYYTDTPLILVSADRPRRLRGTGAPQAIDQSQIFSGFVEKTFDITAGEAFELKIDLKKPYHINVGFDEPLLDGPVGSFEFAGRDPQFLPLSAQTVELSLDRALVVVGSLEKSERANVLQFLQDVSVPIFLEAASGLRGHPNLYGALLMGGDAMVSQLLRSGDVSNVIRIGDVPLGRHWRDLDQMQIPIYSFSNKNFSGTDKSKIFTLDLAHFSGLDLPPWDWTYWLNLGKEMEVAVEGLLLEFPLSEVSFFKKLEEALDNNESLYIGNSLPVRMWDLVNQSPKSIRTNRGANGIDGQISSALGWMSPNTQNKVVLGDLTTLYDFSGLWVSQYLKENKIDVELVVVNNGGGRIFSRIFSNTFFQNQHHLNFAAFADFWGWDYARLETPDSMRPGSGLRMTEWTPCPEQSKLFWQRYDQLWKR